MIENIFNSSSKILSIKKRLKNEKAIFTFINYHLFTFGFNSNAQWLQTNDPYGGNVRTIISNGNNIFAGTTGGGVFLSTNNI